MKYIPRKTKVKMEFYRGITFGDMAYIAVAVSVLLLIIFSTGIPTDVKIYTGVIWAAFAIALFIPTADNKKMYETIFILFGFFARQKRFSKTPTRKAKDVRDIVPYVNIKNDMIDFKDYFGIVLEISPIQFWLLNEEKQEMVINVFANALRSVSVGQTANIVKVSKPMLMDGFIYNEDRKYDEVMELASDDVMSKAELESRSRIFESRMADLRDLSNYYKTYMDHYYIVIHDKDREALVTTADAIQHTLSRGVVTIHCKRLEDSELAVFLKANYGQDLDESELSLIPMDEYVDWTMPNDIQFKASKTIIDGKAYRHFCITDFPINVPNAWAVPFFGMSGVKVVVKLEPLKKDKSERSIDRSLMELENRLKSTFKSSKQIELESQRDTLRDLLNDLKIGNEDLYETHIHITCPDAQRKDVRTILKQNGFKFIEMFGRQMDGFVSTNISRIDKVQESARNIQTTSVAAMFPFISDTLQDEKGFYFGDNGSPVFVDFFVNSDKNNPLHNERVNANMIIIGKSGSGKSYAATTLLANLAADNTRVFILDPEKEYDTLTRNLNGKYIDIGSSVHGILNPFHVMTTLSDEIEDEEIATGEETEEELRALEERNANKRSKQTDSYNQHLQFLEEFFRIIFDGMSGDAFEILNSLVVEIYHNKHIDERTDLAKLKPADYPVFDDLYNLILKKLENERDEYFRRNLQILQAYVQKFASGGRNSKLWNGPTSIETDENFVCFNFQSLMSNRNSTIASAQMLLVFKYLDNEISKNKDFNKKYNARRKIIITVDEAHLFINPKFPVALDFMAQMAKRIRKYMGMQIIITQNIKDFIGGSEETKRQASAIINASQYSMIFSLAPNDITDLVDLYRNAGEINKGEQDTIVTAERGCCFFIASPFSRSTFYVRANDAVKEIADL